MLETKKCYLCKSDDQTVLYKSNLHKQNHIDKNFRFACTQVVFAKRGQIVQCNKCGLIYNSPREDDETLLNRYRNVQDPEYLGEVKSREATYTHLLSEIMKYVPSGRMLDIGSYAGIFLNMARQKNYDVFGIEPSKWTADHSRNNYGLEIFNGPISEYAVNPGTFDVVTMWDVIEHLVNPLEDLKRINRMTKMGGLLAFSTHNIESNAMKLLRGYYPFLVEMHICHFSPRTLRSMLDAAGFEIEHIEKHIRIVRLGYLANKFTNYSKSLSMFLNWVLKKFDAKDKLVPVTFLGLINAYAKKIRDVD